MNRVMNSVTSSNTVIRILRAAGFAAAVILSCTAFTGSADAAVEATAEQRAACTPDAFRLCSGEIPNIPAITACMRKNKTNLSPACKAVFDK
ncbi:hypothetical protein X566_13125 [Afipia sp. P52-10]|nr:hypothetical protein [Afipia sp. P52-10]ETR78496.1 hypothetical protein X566_13125 [Afipia sp. P52-10]